MSTCNFSTPNTSKHYCIGLENDDNFDDIDYDMAIDDVVYQLTEIGGKECEKRDWMDNDTRRLVRFSIDWFDHDYKSWDVGYLTVTIEGGYYQGAMFDIYREDLDTVSNTTERKIEKLWDKIEKILADSTPTHLHRVAVFSNGEGVYERA